MDKIRLSKLMASRGMCSRREADNWIERGFVRVNGKIMSVLGTRVDPDCTISIEPAAEEHQQSLLTVLLNKPVGFVSGQPEPGYRAASTLITRSNHCRNDRVPFKYGLDHQRRMAPAGRLDIDSHGLLVLTQDGRVARQLIGPDSTIDKEYLVRVAGTVDGPRIEALRHGLELDGKVLKPATVDEIEPGLLRMVLIEGRKRQIRRMCDLVGLRVRGLKRVRIGRIRLAGLPKGKWRYLGAGERF